jgi:hypothetical protein
MTTIEPMEIPEADLQMLMAPLLGAGWKVRGILNDYSWDCGSSLMGALERGERRVDIELFGDGWIDAHSYSSDHEYDPDSPGEPPLFQVHSAEELFAEYAARGWLEPPS